MKKIFQIFNLKKDFEYLEKKGYIDNFVNYTITLIKQAAKSGLEKPEKKEFVIKTVASFILKSTIIATNPLLGKIIIFVLPIIVENLYQALKSFVDGLTVIPESVV